MSPSPTSTVLSRVFLRPALLIALAGGFAAAAIALGIDGAKWPWVLLGWAAMAVVGVVQGARLDAVHGRAGNAFLAAMAVGMLIRLFVAAAGVGGGLAFGGQATAISFIGGLAAGYLPLQIFEGVWFARRSGVAGRTQVDEPVSASELGAT